MSLVLVPEPRCACGAALHEDEGDRCAFCRRDERGDEELLCHDERGWIGEGGRRVPCRCGCGMVSVPEPVALERSETVVPMLRPERGKDAAIHRLVRLLDDAGKPLVVSFRHEIEPHAQALLKTLGATYTIDPAAPPCVGLCGQPECEEVPVVNDGLEALRRMDAGEPVKTVEVLKRPRKSQSHWDRDAILVAIQRWASEYGQPPAAADWAKAVEGYPPTFRVQRVFGAWGDAIEAAGFPRPVRGRNRRARTDGRPQPAISPEVPQPEPDPAPPAGGELRTAALALIFHVRSFLDGLEAELRR